MPRPFYLRLDNHPDSVSSRHCRINKFLPAPPEPLTPESHRSAMFRISLLGESYSSERGEPTLTSPDPDAFGADAPRRRYLTPALGALLYTLGEDFQSYLLTRPDLLKMMGDGARIFLFMGMFNRVFFTYTRSCTPCTAYIVYDAHALPALIHNPFPLSRHMILTIY